MRRISLAVALLGAVAAAGCGGSSTSDQSGGAKGVADGTFTVTIQNGQNGNNALAIIGGYVTSTPAGIDCGVAPHTACTASFPSDAPVVLTATPVGTGMMFLGWSGDCAGETCTLTGKADKYIVASFGTERTSHANFSNPLVHQGAYLAFTSGDPGALQCTSCHGASLQGQGIAVSCASCHANPLAPAATVPPPTGGLSGVVTSKAGPVAGAKVYLIPTMDLSSDSIFLPKAYSATAAYAAGALVSAHEGVWKAKQAVTGVEPPTLELWNDATNANWEFVAVVHTPHTYSARTSYKAGDLAIYADTSVTPNTFSVYEALVDMKSTITEPAPWSSITTPVATPGTDPAKWLFIGSAKDLAFFDNFPAFAGTKGYAKGALIRQANRLYQAKAAFTSTATFNALDWNDLGALLDLAQASDVDEPLEGTIRAKAYPAATATTPGYVTTDASGVYTFSAAQLPDAGFSGKYYLTVIPTNSTNLPGGDKCRTPLLKTAIVNTQVNVKLATTPSTTASYVGPSTCLGCHTTKHNTKMTAHGLGIRVVSGERAGKTPDYARFPAWKQPLVNYFDGKTSASPTVLYVKGKGIGGSVAVNDPTGFGTADFVASLFVQNGKYYVKLEKTLGANPWPGDGISDLDGNGTPDAGIYELELTYGGAVYKQRFITKIGTLRHLLPLQYNYDGAGNFADGAPAGRGKWAAYNSSKWGARLADDSATGTVTDIKNPGTTSSFDYACAGCHFTGYKYENATNKAHAVADGNGEMDYDNDGDFDQINLSCESCHGPGSEHVASGSGAAGIVNPALLTPEREITICGQCHTRVRGARNNDTADKLENGFYVIPRVGISRKEFLAGYVTKVDEGMWDSKVGNGKYSKSHHQQASDFLTTEKYRNHGIPKAGWSIDAGKAGLLTCSSCHDLHGDSNVPHQLVLPLDRNNGISDGAGGSTGTIDGLCNSCHSKSLSGANPTASGHNTRGSGGKHNAPNPDFTCASCHVPKTAKSGSGTVAATIATEKFYQNDISSHLFIGVPYVWYAAPSKLSSDAKTVAPDANGYVDIMPIPYTKQCGVCHTQGRGTWKDGTF